MRTTILLLSLMGMTCMVMSQTTLLFEDFEDNTVAYTFAPASGECNNNANIFVTKTNGVNVSSDYNISNVQGNKKHAAL
ncbi:MAG: hypothetical protein AAFO07_22575, partial [Bacteroidota bacterium]